MLRAERDGLARHGGTPLSRGPSVQRNRPALFPRQHHPGRAASPGWPRGSDLLLPTAIPARERAPSWAAQAFYTLHWDTAMGAGAGPSASAGLPRALWATRHRDGFPRPLLALAAAAAPGRTSLCPAPRWGNCIPPFQLETGYFHSPAFQPPLAIQGTALSPSREPQCCQQPLSCWSMSLHPSLGRATQSREPGGCHPPATCPCALAGACGMWEHSRISFVQCGDK